MRAAALLYMLLRGRQRAAGAMFGGAVAPACEALESAAAKYKQQGATAAAAAARLLHGFALGAAAGLDGYGAPVHSSVGGGGDGSAIDAGNDALGALEGDAAAEAARRRAAARDAADALLRVEQELHAGLLVAQQERRRRRSQSLGAWGQALGALLSPAPAPAPTEDAEEKEGQQQESAAESQDRSGWGPWGSGAARPALATIAEGTPTKIAEGAANVAAGAAEALRAAAAAAGAALLGSPQPEAASTPGGRRKKKKKAAADNRRHTMAGGF